MKKFFLIFAIFFSLMLTSTTYANWFADIVNRIEKTNVINAQIYNNTGAALGIQQDMLTSQKDIEKLIREVNNSVIGHSGWGTYQFHDYQSYGEGARDWSGVMQMAQNGQGSGELGQMIRGIASQFPSDRSAYNRGIAGLTSQNYYALKSKTVLAARAASELDYNKIQQQIAYQQMLQQQIERTKDLKAAVDLSNRIQVESNLIQLEILRQAALANQQQALTEQATINAALSNARFLTN